MNIDHGGMRRCIGVARVEDRFWVLLFRWKWLVWADLRVALVVNVLDLAPLGDFVLAAIL